MLCELHAGVVRGRIILKYKFIRIGLEIVKEYTNGLHA